MSARFAHAGLVAALLVGCGSSSTARPAPGGACEESARDPAPLTPTTPTTPIVSPHDGPVTPDLTPDVYRVAVDGAPSLGSREAAVTIAIFGDYSSASTRSSDRVLRALVAARADVRYVWKHAPLRAPEAQRAAALAEAALRAGRFWELHRLLMELDRTDADGLRRAGREAHLDASAVALAIAGDGELPGRIHADRRQARDLGVTVTPAIFINGQLLLRAISVERLAELVDEAAAAGERVRRAGVPAEDVYTRLVGDGLVPGTAVPRDGLVVQGLAVGPDEPRRVVEPGSGPWLGGSARAPVQIVWFGDLRCPFTARQAASLIELATARPDDVRVTWRHLPLEIHPDAELAHRAAAAAGAQRRFWPFARRLLAHPGEIDRATTRRFAAEAGLDLERFESDLDGPAVAERIEGDRAYGRDLAPDLVPSTLFINGTRVTVAASLAVLEELVDDALRDGRPAMATNRRGGLR